LGTRTAALRWWGDIVVAIVSCAGARAIDIGYDVRALACDVPAVARV
jgi:hypothetical protein